MVSDAGEPTSCYRFRPFGHVTFYEAQEMCRATSSSGSLLSPMIRDSKEWTYLQDALAFLPNAFEDMKIWDGIHQPTASRNPAEIHVDGSTVSPAFWTDTDPWPIRNDEYYYRNTPSAYKSTSFTHENCMVWKYKNNSKINVGKPLEEQTHPIVCKGERNL